jgi:hypothetical protein
LIAVSGNPKQERCTVPIIRRRPDKTEYAEYYDRYVSQVPDGDVIETMRAQRQAILDLLGGVPPAKADSRYAPGKWTLKEVVGHVLDVEWVFTYRALSFARRDASPLPGIDQEEFVAGANFSARALPEMAQEYHHLRSANILLFDSFDETVLDRGGVASDCRLTVRAILYIIAGHERHHMNVLRERYLT